MSVGGSVAIAVGVGMGVAAGNGGGVAVGVGGSVAIAVGVGMCVAAGNGGGVAVGVGGGVAVGACPASRVARSVGTLAWTVVSIELSAFWTDWTVAVTVAAASGVGPGASPRQAIKVKRPTNGKTTSAAFFKLLPGSTCYSRDSL